MAGTRLRSGSLLKSTLGPEQLDLGRGALSLGLQHIQLRCAAYFESPPHLGDKPCAIPDLMFPGRNHLLGRLRELSLRVTRLPG